MRVFVCAHSCEVRINNLYWISCCGMPWKRTTCTGIHVLWIRTMFVKRKQIYTKCVHCHAHTGINKCDHDRSFGCQQGRIQINDITGEGLHDVIQREQISVGFWIPPPPSRSPLYKKRSQKRECRSNIKNRRLKNKIRNNTTKLSEENRIFIRKRFKTGACDFFSNILTRRCFSLVVATTVVTF